MQKLFVLVLKALKAIKVKIISPFHWLYTFILFYMNGIQFGSFKSFGVPNVNVSIGGEVLIGSKFRMNNNLFSNNIGRVEACNLIVGKNGKLIIDDNVGLSGSTIVCQDSVIIGSNVNLGGNVVIYDTDFHSLNKFDRLDTKIDKINTNTKPVIIGSNVFVGGHSTILKGVKIGENVIIGACSVVTKDVPDNQLWAGNPAKFIRELN
jgi:acetyltransferase-like isoleucine patch superfamily enzyme